MPKNIGKNLENRKRRRKTINVHFEMRNPQYIIEVKPENCTQFVHKSYTFVE